MLIYPVLGIWADHGLMAGPMFGVPPCPMTIFTIGMLLLARGLWVFWLSIIPFLWSLIELMAALHLGMYEDLGLPLGGIVLISAHGMRSARARRDSGSSEDATRTAVL
jgi:hypothetical protein